MLKKVYNFRHFCDFCTADKIKNVDRLQSQKLNTFFGHLPGAGRQNRVQNRHFSENPRWGPYKNHKNITKFRFA